jgi:hypothetical protein
MIDHEQIIREQQIDQEIALALESSEYDFEEEPDDLEEFIEQISMTKEEDDYGEERYFEKSWSIRGTKIA